jgi:type IV secretory pathway protease TraF
MNRAILAVAALGVAAAVAPGVFRPSPLLLWNASASAPIGLYRVQPSRSFEVGDWVAARTPAALARAFAERRYLPLGVSLVKRVAAVAPSVVCRGGRRIAIDAAPVARALDADHLGRPLPTWRGCRRLGAGQVFLLNAAPDSLDGRYFGPTTINALIGRLTPIWLTGRVSR